MYRKGLRGYRLELVAYKIPTQAASPVSLCVFYSDAKNVVVLLRFQEPNGPAVFQTQIISVCKIMKPKVPPRWHGAC